MNTITHKDKNRIPQIIQLLANLATVQPTNSVCKTIAKLLGSKSKVLNTTDCYLMSKLTCETQSLNANASTNSDIFNAINLAWNTAPDIHFGQLFFVATQREPDDISQISDAKLSHLFTRFAKTME